MPQQWAWWLGVVLAVIASLVGYAVARRQRLFQDKWVAVLFSLMMAALFLVGDSLLPEYRLLLFAVAMGVFGFVVWYWQRREQHGN